MRLEVGVVHARLPELARVPVILPVVVPVPPAVGPEAVHVHLRGRAARVTPRQGPGSRGRGRALGRGRGREGGRGAPTEQEVAHPLRSAARAWKTRDTQP